MLIFREVEDFIAVTRAGLTLLSTYQADSSDDQRLVQLQRLASYIKSMEWLKHEAAKKRISVFLACQYDYRLAAQKLGIQIDQMHKSISYANKRLSGRIRGVLTLMKEGRWADAELEFQRLIGSHRPFEPFICGTVDRFKPRKSSTVNLIDCRREIEVIAHFTKRKLENILSTVDGVAMSHVLHILLSADPRYIAERLLLSQCIISGELKPEQVIGAIETNQHYSLSGTNIVHL
ncbi:hypothetical protein SAMN03159341_10419 [Paenibacillus sp. 1_12]|uniref:hypothetical protein n=1 Tax=Paenibacillus sp. 1_12 TaxID=1566278 RepID=UPI0008E257FB|nr:hypothetical protein [Paenibacillus sp. 1_12]SFL20920.1 hypothetical protein SAMN03159341_10419 [Paenibacillus sp. 1_12]